MKYIVLLWFGFRGLRKVMTKISFTLISINFILLSFMFRSLIHEKLFWYVIYYRDPILFFSILWVTSFQFHLPKEPFFSWMIYEATSIVCYVPTEMGCSSGLWFASYNSLFVLSLLSHFLKSICIDCTIYLVG